MPWNLSLSLRIKKKARSRWLEAESLLTVRRAESTRELLLCSGVEGSSVPILLEGWDPLPWGRPPFPGSEPQFPRSDPSILGIRTQLGAVPASPRRWHMKVPASPRQEMQKWDTSSQHQTAISLYGS